MRIRERLDHLLKLEGKGFIGELYQQLLNREVDVEGVMNFTSLLHAGTSKTDIMRTILGSLEAQGIYVPSPVIDTSTIANTLCYFMSLEDRLFIETLYQEVLLRTPDAEKLQGYLSSLQNGSSQLSIIAEVMCSVQPQLLLPLRLNWNSLVNLPIYGYCNSSKNLMLALDRNEVDVSYRYVYGPGTPYIFNEPLLDPHPHVRKFRYRRFDPTQPEVVYGQGDVFVKNQGAYKIGFTMLEVDGIPPEWVRQCNLMNEVWVPSTFNVQTFQDSGVTVPIHVIPLGIDSGIYNPGVSGVRYSPKFTFLTVFQWQERKNPHVLIDAFIKGFSHKEDVVLVLKTTQDVSSELRGLGYGSYLDTNKIILDVRVIPEHELGSIYRGADCFVFPTSGEGWGMPILEAMACGIPTIATDWSAQKDFLTEETGYPIRVRGLKPASTNHAYYAGFNWADPDVDHLIELMNYVYEHRDAAHERSVSVSQEILGKWTWDHSAQKMIERLITIRN